MANDIDKLVKYAERIEKLNEMNKDSDKNEGAVEAFDSVEIAISPQALITTRWSNKTGSHSKTEQFSFQTIGHFSELARKAITYREGKTDESDE